MPFIAIALAAAVFLGGGVSLAADHAKPNEPLYQYKVHVNDQVRAGAQTTAHEAEKVGSSLKAALHLSGSAKTEADSETDSDADAQTDATADVSTGAKINVDAPDVSGSLNADGSVKVNVF
ncbi:MAG TPA: hypothetical protein VHD37_01680 [Candidatus Paceibacterota bacterium]|nr:hypothetical protein [Candidatus Paceibacterota bacterium]